MNDIKKPVGNLRSLILLCVDNIKGMTEANKIEELLPIETENIKINKTDKNIEIFLNGNLEKRVWKDTDCYMNLEILKSITKQYNISYTNDEILELMKYKNKIELMLL